MAQNLVEEGLERREAGHLLYGYICASFRIKRDPRSYARLILREPGSQPSNPPASGDSRQYSDRRGVMHKGPPAKQGFDLWCAV